MTDPTLCGCDSGKPITECRRCAADAKAAGPAEYRAWLARRMVAETTIDFPARFRAAVTDRDDVLAWAAEVHTTGRSLLVSGPLGTGKTYLAYAAIRATVAHGRFESWTAVNYADFCEALRPSNPNPEAAMRNAMTTGLLLLDDMGAARSSAFTEEAIYRMVNARYEHNRPMILTTNLPPGELVSALGDRIASRLAEMCTVVPVVGRDRRRAA